MRSDLKRPVEVPDAGAFSAIYRSQVHFVWRSLRRLGVREADVEDVCQETFVIAYRKFSAFDGTSQVRTWLFGIALRKASEYRRLKHVRCEYPVDSVPEQASPESQVDALQRRDARVLLDQILDTLDEYKRAVFVLYELEQLPMSEVAVLLDCPLQTAYSRLHAAKRTVEGAIGRLHLRERLG